MNLKRIQEKNAQLRDILNQKETEQQKEELTKKFEHNVSRTLDKLKLDNNFNSKTDIKSL